MLSLSAADVFCVYGFPDPTFLKELEEWLEEDVERAVVIFEDEEKYLYQKSHHDRIYICNAENEEALKKLAWDWIFLSFDYAKRTGNPLKSEEKMQAVFSKFVFFQEGVHLIASDFKERGLDLLQNFFENSFLFPNAYEGKGLFGAFSDIPAIICGAGMSLEKAIPYLRHLQDHALLFAGGTTLSSLAQVSLQPHFGGLIDPHLPMDRHFLHQAFEVPLFFQSRAQPALLRQMQGPLLKIAGSGNDFFEEETFDGGWNVTTFLTALACHLGCNPIIFVGVDHVQKGEQVYAGGFETEEEEKFIETNEGLSTKRDWLFAVDWLSQFAKSHPEVRWINASNGIQIKGIEECFLSEIVFDRQDDLSGLVHSRIQALKKGVFPFFSKEKLQTSFARVATLCNEILILLEQIFPNPPEKNGEYALLELEIEKEMAYTAFLSPVWEIWKFVFQRKIPKDVPKEYGIRLNQWLFMKGICDDARKI